MGETGKKRAEIEQLLEELDQLSSTMGEWQKAGAADPEDIQDTERRYVRWYARALKVIPDSELAKFKDMYEGGNFITRVKAFLAGPLDTSPIWNPDEPSPFFPKWKYDFADRPRASLGTQREILIHALHEAGEIGKVLDELSFVFRRLPELLDQLRRSNNPNVPLPNIENEKDLQDLVHAILRMMFKDVRAEDFVPQQAGASSRTDFLLQDIGILVETKMTRRGLNDRKVGEELLIDWGRYPRHPDCKGILAIVYDPKRFIQNDTALEKDLYRDSANLVARVIVVR
ncbi:MAG TPA: hypothetical protein DGT23_00840 [Micromonosporaceae bacterium]|nr:hypothetical protein [Micromonosporaceae bacterium]